MKNIMIAVAGSTPQIITESLYDLMIQRKVSIDSIVILTTKHGREKCEQMLLNPVKGAFYTFCKDYQMMPHTISVSIETILDGQGQELYDIRTEQNNQNAATFINDQIARLCNDAENTIYATIAGGRKTMSAYLAYAMQFHARKQDKLFHVLIEPGALESNTQFFYPPPQSDGVLQLKDQQGNPLEIPSDKIKITNAEIPFIRLREHIAFMGSISPLSYADMVRYTQDALDQSFIPQVSINIDDCLLEIQWRNYIWKIAFKPLDLAFYSYMLDKREIVNTETARHAEAIQQIYEQIRPGVGDMPLFSTKDLTDSRSRINRLFDENLDCVVVRDFLKIESKQRKRIPTYRIRLPRQK